MLTYILYFVCEEMVLKEGRNVSKVIGVCGLPDCTFDVVIDML